MICPLSLQQLCVVGDFSLFMSVFSMCVSLLQPSIGSLWCGLSVRGSWFASPEDWTGGGLACGEVDSDTAGSWLLPQLKVITSPLCPHCTSESPRLTVHRVTDLQFYVHCVMWEQHYSLYSVPSQLISAAAQVWKKSATSLTTTSPLISRLACVTLSAGPLASKLKWS